MSRFNSRGPSGVEGIGAPEVARVPAEVIDRRDTVDRSREVLDRVMATVYPYPVEESDGNVISVDFSRQNRVVEDVSAAA